MGDAQQMLPNPVREWLVAFIAEQTGVTNPTDVRFVWTGLGRGVVTCTEEGMAKYTLTVAGADADALAALENGDRPLYGRQRAVSPVFRDLNRGGKS